MTTSNQVKCNPSIRNWFNEPSATTLRQSISQSTQSHSMKKIAKAIEDLTYSLSSNGYSVTIKDIRDITCVKADHLVSIEKSCGPKRYDCKGGYLLVNKDGFIQYDFFVGGCKYGAHLNSYLSHVHDGFVRNVPVPRILHFLSSDESGD